MQPGDRVLKLLSAVGDYSSSDLRALPRDTRVIFAESPNERFITSTFQTPAQRNSLAEKRWEELFSSIGSLRCERSQEAAFSAYPTTEKAVECNKFLWQAVQNSSFSAKTAADLFEKNVYCISLPEGLYNFLATVSWEAIEETLLYVLATIAEDEDDAMDLLQSELASSLYAQVGAFCQRDSREPPAAFRIMMDQVFNFIFSLGPWTIPVSLSYISAEDMGLLENGEAPTALKRGHEEVPRQNAIMYKLYCDFRVYEKFLYPQLSRVQMLDVMARVIAGKNHPSAWSAVDELLLMVKKGQNAAQEKKSQNLLAILPLELVLDFIIPSVIVRYAEDVPSGIAQKSQDVPSSHRSTSMDDVDAELDAMEQDESKFDGMEIGDNQECPFQSYRNPSPWSLKFMLLEHRTLLRHYYGIGADFFDESDDDSESDEEFGDERDGLGMEDADNEGPMERSSQSRSHVRVRDPLDVQEIVIEVQ